MYKYKVLGKMKTDLIRCVTRWGISIADMCLPVFYHDSSRINAVYSASSKMVKQYLPDQFMHPLEIAPGRCLVAFTAFEYRMSDIGLYNKFSIAFMVSYGEKSIPVLTLKSQIENSCFDMYIRHLPVTTESARIGGIETYGFPKILADITFNRNYGMNECIVKKSGIHILTLRVPDMKTTPGDNLHYRVFAQRQGVTLCSNIYTKNHEYSETVNTDGVDLFFEGDHEICRELRLMDLSRKAILCQYIPSCETLISIPRNLKGII